MIYRHEHPVLVAEANDQEFDFIAEALHEADYLNPLRRVVTGKQCLELLRASHEVMPALILLDLNLTGMDGREALIEIKQAPDLCDLPVVILSASSHPRDIEFCYRHGANSYHLKPLETPIFKRIVKEIAGYWLDAAVLPRKALL